MPVLFANQRRQVFSRRGPILGSRIFKFSHSFIRSNEGRFKLNLLINIATDDNRKQFLSEWITKLDLAHSTTSQNQTRDYMERTLDSMTVPT